MSNLELWDTRSGSNESYVGKNPQDLVAKVHLGGQIVRC
jgi:hypothetical protein